MAPAGAQAAPVPLPPETWRSGERSQHLRAEIFKTRAQIAELQRVVQEARNLEDRQTRLRAVMNVVEREQDRARTAVSVAGVLFIDSPRRVRDGTASFDAEGAKVEIRQGLGVESVAEALSALWTQIDSV